MRPAFSSNGKAASFAILVLVVLSLPLVLTKKLLPPSKEVYSAIPWSIGGFPYIHDQIFEEKSDIDIAFMGSSVMWWGIDTLQVQRELEKKLGRKAVVRSLCWNWQGFDPFYKVMKDLLEHRNVRMIVFYDVNSGAPPTAHSQAAHWFRLADDPESLSGLNARTKASFYSSAILSAPKNILGFLRDNLPAIPSSEVTWRSSSPQTRNPATRLGSLSLRLRMDKPFEDYLPSTTINPSAGVRLSEATKNQFKFEKGEVNPTQANFIRKISTLATKHNVKLVYLNLPRKSDMRSPTINEQVFWPSVFQTEVFVVGIPPLKLFEGVSDEDVWKLYWDFQHFNENGQKFFTPRISPQLTELYERSIQTKH